MKLGTLIVIVLLVLIVPIAGYVKNIKGLIGCDFEPPYKAEIIRGIGVVIPVVGMITGYCDIPDGEMSE